MLHINPSIKLILYIGKEKKKRSMDAVFRNILGLLFLLINLLIFLIDSLVKAARDREREVQYDDGEAHCHFFFLFFSGVISTCFCLVMYILLEKPMFVMDTTWVSFS